MCSCTYFVYEGSKAILKKIILVILLVVIIVVYVKILCNSFFNKNTTKQIIQLILLFSGVSYRY